MPKRVINRQEIAERLAASEPVTVEAKEGIAVDAPASKAGSALPSPEAQQAVMDPEAAHHVIKLIDGSEVKLPKQLTIQDLLRKRIDGKIMALIALLRAESAKFEGLNDEAKVVNVIASSDSVYDAILDIIAKVSGEMKSRLADNIEVGELFKAFGVLVAMVNVMGEKKQTTEKPK